VFLFILRFYLLIILVVLDPRISYSGLWADCCDDLSIKSHLELVKGQLVQHYCEQYLRDAPPPTQQQPVMLPSTSSTSPQKVNFTARYRQRPRATVNELEEFFSLPQEDFETCDPLQWWAGHCSQFPNLSHFACDILSMPGMF
jgi:hAT family C-terminal dimerisation region